MADIECAEVLDSQQYVTGDMVEDVANVPETITSPAEPCPLGLFSALAGNVSKR